MADCILWLTFIKGPKRALDSPGQIGQASDNVAICSGQTGVVPLRVTPPAPVQNERYRTPAILDILDAWRRRSVAISAVIYPCARPYPFQGSLRFFEKLEPLNCRAPLEPLTCRSGKSMVQVTTSPTCAGPGTSREAFVAACSSHASEEVLGVESPGSHQGSQYLRIRTATSHLQATRLQLLQLERQPSRTGSARHNE